MARTGDHFKMPDGSVYVVRRSAAETGGELVEMEFAVTRKRDSAGRCRAARSVSWSAVVAAVVQCPTDSAQRRMA